jgi:hypothetical protein
LLLTLQALQQLPRLGDRLAFEFRKQALLQLFDAARSAILLALQVLQAFPQSLVRF